MRYKNSFVILAAVLVLLLVSMATGKLGLMAIPIVGMAMNVMKSNIISSPCDIFFAARTSETTPTTLPSLAELNAGGSATWKFVGGTEEDSTKIAIEPNYIAIHDGTKRQSGVTVKLETRGMQTDYAQIQTMEGLLIDGYVDVLCREVGTTKCHRLQRMGGGVGLELLMSRKKNNAMLPVVERTAGKATEAYDIVTVS